jgi:hypothetical protein
VREGDWEVKLTVKDAGNDWWVIERAEHNGGSWFERTPYGMAFMTASRFSDADVEGTGTEMLDIAAAIENRSRESHKRCAVDARTEPVRFCSPRNSQRDGECSLAEADALAAEIREKVKK